MQAQSDVQTSGQAAPMNKNKKQGHNTVIPFSINGCAVSFTSNANSTNEPLAAVKEILLSAYRTRTTKG